MIIARDYQSETIAQCRAAFAEGYKSIVIVLPTGGGKTCVAALIMSGALANGSRLLFTAHRRELIAQTYWKMVDAGVPESKLGIIMGDGVIRNRAGVLVRAHRPNAPIQIASIDSLRHRNKPRADIVFIDECHRCLSKSYLDLKDAYPDAVQVGLTATPYRNGGKGLGPFYEKLVIGALPSRLIEEGHIVAPRVWTVPPDELPDLSQLKRRGGDYAEDELAEACNTKQLVGSIVEHWLKCAEGRQTVVFPVNVAHSKQIVSDFVTAGVRAEHVDGSTATAERDAILRRLETGETTIVSSCGVLSEGWDCPVVKCAILARPTTSTGLYLQQAGRILRPWKGIGAIILDHAGNALSHGLPSEDREFSLDDVKKKKKRKGEDEEAPSTKACPECFAVVESKNKACPECGYVWVSAPREIDHVDGQLEEYTAEGQAEKRAYWDNLTSIAAKNDYKPGWAANRFKQKYGHWPPKSFPRAVGRAMTGGELDVFRAKLARVAQSRGLPQQWVDKKVESEKERAHLGAASEAPTKPSIVPWAV